MASINLVWKLKQWVKKNKKAQEQRKETISMIASYVPNIVLESCMSTVPLWHEVRAVRSMAAVVIVDISGFSKLSEFLITDTGQADEGGATPPDPGGKGGMKRAPSSRNMAGGKRQFTRSGTEKMQRILNTYFGKLVGTITNYGGDVRVLLLLLLDWIGE